VTASSEGRSGRFRPTLSAHAHSPAKGRLPRPRSAHIHRDSLIRLLEPHRGLVVILAPPGFGKTTLLGQWAGEDDRTFAWMSLDATDNDPIVFWRYVDDTIRSLTDGSPLRSDAPSDPGAVIARLLGELGSLESEIVLVLDDAHSITNPVCLATLQTFLEQVPDNVTVAVSARADPLLAIGELRVYFDLVEIRAPELAFTLEESEAFLNGALAVGLSPAAIRTLWERTEGWPAGLYLAYLSLREAANAEAFVEEFGGSSLRVVDYLTEVVVDAQDERTRDFLLCSSIVDRMTGPLCDALLETDGSAKLLRRLERASLFITALDDHRDWYRYHRLFRDLLRDELNRRHPERMAGLHRRAARWFRDTGDTGQAIAHAQQAGEREMAVRALSENYLRTLEWGGVATIEGWLREFSGTDIAADPRLAVAEAWVMSFQGRYAEADAAVDSAVRADYRGALPDGARSVHASAALVRASAPRDDIGEMLKAARTAFELEGGSPSMWRVTTHVQLGWALALSGAFEEAESLLERASVEAPLTEQWLNALGARCLLAWTSLYRDRIAEADRWASEGIRVGESHGLTDNAAGHWAYATLGAVRAAQGRLDEADELLARSIERMRTATPPILLVEALLAFAPVARAKGESARARAALQEASSIVDPARDAGIVREHLERVARTLAAAQRRASGGNSLTERELDVLRLLEKGMSKRQIARALYVSFNTVHSHTKSIYRKLGAVSRDEAMRIAVHRGILGETSVSRE
jgi:LuxR family maltose regulon positive regulatory protein